jgi:SAM-dependent methyltransferase
VTGIAEAEYLRVTKAAYDTVAVDYERLLRDELGARPLDRAMLAAFGELVGGAAAGPVADLGCGPGRVTAYLASLGVDVFGVDLSPEMVAVARERHPGLRFEVGSMTGLELADGSLGGAVAWHSTVHTPPELLPKVFGECRRALAPGGRLLLAYKVGDLIRRLERAYGHEFERELDVYWLAEEEVADALARAGLEVEARLVREPQEDEARASQGRQGFFLAQRP